MLMRVLICLKLKFGYASVDYKADVLNADSGDSRLQSLNFNMYYFLFSVSINRKYIFSNRHSKTMDL